MKFDAGHTSTTTTSVDWADIKARILARLDVAAEFEAIGVRFSRTTPNEKGIRECHAVGREDANPSAFVNVTSGVYHDSGGEGLTLHLFDAALRWGSHGRWLDVVRYYATRADVDIGAIAPGKGGRVRESISLYRNENGDVAYGVFRYKHPNGKKDFTQHPSDGRGGWKYGAGCMDGVDPLPYRLPELLASDRDEPVWIVEGEKDADRLASLGLVATTNHQGAHSTDRTWPRFAHFFRGRECYILPDNDPGGRAHAQRVAKILEPIARSVKVVPLPGLPPKGDVSDWLDIGHDLDELGQLAFQAPTWSPDSAPPSNPEDDLTRDATVADLRRIMSEEAWLWPGWIPTAALTLLAAEGGTGKTRFLFDLHRRLVHGLPWPDGKTHQHKGDIKVVWVAADAQWREMMEITRDFGLEDSTVVLNATAADPCAGTSLQTEEEIRDLETRIMRIKPALVMIDTVTNTSDAKAQDPAEAKRQYKPLQDVATRTQVPIVCVTHLNASGKVLGRRAVEKVRVVIQMEQPDPEGEPHRRKLWVSKSNSLIPPPLGMTMGSNGNEYDSAIPEPPEELRNGRPARKTEMGTALREAVEWLRSYMTFNGRTRVKVVRDASEQEGIDSKTLYRAKSRLGIEESTVDGYKFWDPPIAISRDGRDGPAF